MIKLDGHNRFLNGPKGSILIREDDEITLILFDPKGRNVYESQKIYSHVGEMEYSISLD